MKTLAEPIELTGGKEEFLAALDEAVGKLGFIAYKHGRGWEAQGGEKDPYNPEDFREWGFLVKEEDYEQIRVSIIAELEGPVLMCVVGEMLDEALV